MLQLNLITEQKIAKLISLVEELRTDLPNVKNRDDEEADLMKQATDPQAILEVIHKISDPSPTDIPRSTPIKPKASLIFNPVAGQGDPAQDLATIESLLGEGIELETIVTTAECEPGELAKAASDRGAALIIASGGDGTLSAVAAALMGTDH